MRARRLAKRLPQRPRCPPAAVRLLLQPNLQQPLPSPRGGGHPGRRGCQRPAHAPPTSFPSRGISDEYPHPRVTVLCPLYPLTCSHCNLSPTLHEHNTDALTCTNLPAFSGNLCLPLNAWPGANCLWSLIDFSTPLATPIFYFDLFLFENCPRGRKQLCPANMCKKGKAFFCKGSRQLCSPEGRQQFVYYHVFLLRFLSCSIC